MPRTRRIVFPGYPHHVTHRGNGGELIFRDIEAQGQFLSMLAHYSDKFKCRILGYCLMSNHVHLVIVPETEDGLGKCMHGIAFLYAQRFNRMHAHTGHLWESRYYSCPVDTDEHLWRMMRYIYRNPVRAGIVSTPWDYRWSSVRSAFNGASDSWINLDTWLDPSKMEDFRDYLFWDEEPGPIRLATKRGMPFGNFYRIL